MGQTTKDKWAAWFLERRHGGDARRMEAVLARLYPVRDRVLDHVHLKSGEVLLDVGCGDGLIAFGALERFPEARVTFADISQDLIDHAQALARQMRVEDRCRFVQTPAEDLSPIAGRSVDSVTMRSVLIYIERKQQVFNEFYRVLKPGGRLSIFEPINRVDPLAPVDIFWGLDMSPVKELADRITEVFVRVQPPGTDPMLNFDERDLVDFAEEAGFEEVHLALEVEVKPIRTDPNVKLSWDTLLKTAGYPQAPTLGEVMTDVLTPEERERFTAHLKPKVDAKEGTRRTAVAYLWATK